MCGICGIIDFKQAMPQEKRQELVKSMNHAILHRGPDADGFLHNREATLGMRRLSIIDLHNGAQPIENENGKISVLFNGEIYNYPDLKRQMIDKGHQFKTQADTEVLVHLYEEYGVEFVAQLKGMFAFCIHDAEQNLYLIARDRFGEKPFYYHFDEKVFSFSSEVKSLLENTTIDRKLNHEAIPYYFRTSLVPEPLTLLNNVYSLEPGQLMIVDSSGMNIQNYFSADYTVDEKFQDEGEAIQTIEPLLQQAVERQLLSDVPVGAFLSGGIDSSSIVALMQAQRNQAIPTFTVRFEDQAYDESPIARKVATHCGTDHHELVIPNLNFEESIFWKIIDHVGLPFRDSSAIPTYFISEAIAKEVKVALSGDGGDELFGGYQIFQWYQKINEIKKIPRLIRTATHTGIGVLERAPFFSQSSTLRKTKRGLGSTLLDLHDIPISLNEFFDDAQFNSLLSSKDDKLKYSDSRELSRLKKYPKDFEDYSPLRKIMFYRLYHTLPSNMLIKVDRMSMANSLEVRAPFLDPDLFNATLKLPDHLLIQNSKGKYLIRKIMQKYLPKEVFDHPKQGFNIPLFKYQNTAFKTLAKKLLFDENPWPSFFKEKELNLIYQRGINQKKDTSQMSVFQASHHLWMMMQLLGWAKRFKVSLY